MEGKDYVKLCILFAVLALGMATGWFLPLIAKTMLTVGALFCAGVAVLCWREYKIKKD